MSFRKIAPIFVAALAVVSTAALAATQTKSGAVKSTDAAAHRLTLDSGDTFEVGSNVSLGKIKAGDKVAITYEMKNGKMWASKVKPAK